MTEEQNEIISIGSKLGLTPVQSLKNIFMIKEKPTLTIKGLDILVEKEND